MSRSTSLARAPQRIRNLLPQLDTTALALRNRAFGATPFVLSNERVLIWQDSLHLNPVGELHCQVGENALFIAADNLSAIEPRLLGMESMVASEACTSLVEHALSPVLDLIERLSGRPLSCETFRRLMPRPGDESLVRVGFSLLSPQQPELRGWMRAGPALWRTLDFARGTALPARRYQGLPLSLSAQLGACRLPVSELRLLQPGDALRITPLIPRRNQGLPVRLVHVGGSFSCRARLSGDQLIPETLMTSHNTLPPKQPSPPAQAAKTAAAGAGAATGTAAGPSSAPAGKASQSETDFVNGVECELSFEIGTLRLSLGEIGKLRVGQGLRLGVNLQDQPVRILTSGREIARGELAAVGDEIVVVVTQTHGLPNI